MAYPPSLADILTLLVEMGLFNERSWWRELGAKAKVCPARAARRRRQRIFAQNKETRTDDGLTQ